MTKAVLLVGLGAAVSSLLLVGAGIAVWLVIEYQRQTHAHRLWHIERQRREVTKRIFDRYDAAIRTAVNHWLSRMPHNDRH